MKVLLDTNVVLDLLLDRAPWPSTLGPVVHAATHGRLELWVAGTTLTNVFYVARKIAGLARARDAVNACLANFRVAAVNEVVLRDAAALGGADFEDDVQIAAARAEGLDGVLTRDPKGFAASPLSVWDPIVFGAILTSR